MTPLPSTISFQTFAPDHPDDSPLRWLPITTTHHFDDSPSRRLTITTTPISTTYHHDDSPFRRLTVTTNHHFDDLPSRRITISTTFHYEREVVPVSRHEREVVPVSRHEKEAVTTSHYDHFALRRRPSISMTFHYDETFLTRSPRHITPTNFNHGIAKRGLANYSVPWTHCGYRNIEFFSVLVVLIDMTWSRADLILVSSQEMI